MRWWLGALRTMLPASWMNPVRRPRAGREIALGHDGSVEIRDIARNGTVRLIRRFESVSLFRDTVVSRDLKSNRLTVSVDIRKCFTHCVSIPPGANSQRDALLRLELLRITPFRLSEVYSGWMEGGHHAVTHALLRRDFLTPVLLKLRDMKCTEQSIIVRDAEGRLLPLRLTIAEPPVPGRRERIWRKLAFGTSVAAALAFTAAVGSAFDRQYQHLAVLQTRIDAVGKDAGVVRKRLEDMATASHRVISLRARKIRQPSVLAAWNELTALMPDEAWLSSISIENNTLSIEGEARAAEPLIPVLDASPLFSAVAFAGPVTTSGDSTHARFTIRMTLTPNGSLP
ncbi:hypothetical protein BH10PSE7_BH10PSE7_29570 [soil metagenome]